jgi:nicotinamide mononucleotide adenylyltransferase
MMFDSTKPTVQMLGRWQPWHSGHTALFKKALEITGQVVIMVRDVGEIVGEDVGGGRTNEQSDNPFSTSEVVNRIQKALCIEGFELNKHFIILVVPNIVDISYGRGVGYTFTEHDLGEEVHKISATALRQNLRDLGKL